MTGNKVKNTGKYKRLISRFCIPLLLMVFVLLIMPPSSIAEGSGKKFYVIVSNRPLAINRVIKKGDVRIVLRPSWNPREAHDLSEVIGKKVRRPIGKNNTIKKDYLEDAPLVRKGDMVILFVERGSLKVTVKGIARESGSVGKIIEVENISSGKVVSGRVVEARMVAADF